MDSKYVIKWGQETFWAVLVAVTAAVAVWFAGADFTAVFNDPRVAAAALGAAVVRVVGAVVWNQLQKFFNRS